MSKSKVIPLAQSIWRNKPKWNSEKVKICVESFYAGFIENSLKYRDKNYFNDKDYYLIDGTNLYVDRLHFDRNHWWTNSKTNYKCTSIRMVNITKELFINSNIT